MTDAEFIAEIRRRIAATKAVEGKTAKAWEGVTPQWATYFQGYRDALSEMIELVEESHA